MRSIDHTIGVLMPVLNEAKYVKATIESVLSQTYQDWILYISDNHSTDNSSEIIGELADCDQRIIKLKPDRYYALSFDHTNFLRNHVLSDPRTLYGTIFLGGHDLMPPNYLEALLGAMLSDPSCAMVYPLDSYAIDERGKFLHKHSPSPQTFSEQDPFQSLATILSLCYNIPFCGLIRYSAWEQVPWRHSCTGNDHFMTAEFSLKGRIKGTGNSLLQLRNPTNDLKAYKEKHFAGKLDPCTDMLRQLEWLHHLCIQALSNYPDVERNCMFASMATMYILKFIWIFNNDQEAIDQFFALPEINNLIGGQTQLGAALSARCAQTDLSCRQLETQGQ